MIAYLRIHNYLYCLNKGSKKGCILLRKIKYFLNFWNYKYFSIYLYITMYSSNNTTNISLQQDKGLIEQVIKFFEPILFYDFLLLDNYSKSAEVNLVCKGQFHENTMTHTKKCMRTFNTKLDNKLRSFRAMKVNWFCQKQGIHLSNSKMLYERNIREILYEFIVIDLFSFYQDFRYGRILR